MIGFFFAKVDPKFLILLTWKSFHSNMKVAIKIEKDSVIPSLDVLAMKILNETVYCKKTSSNLK